jgi:hypothetical protein
LRTPSSSWSPYHDPHCTIYYLGYPIGRFAGLKHRQLAHQVGVIITTGRIRRTLVNKINLLVNSLRSIEASRLAPVKAESIFPTPHLRLPRHVARLVTWLVVDCSASRRLVVHYFSYAARPSASACRAARHAARRTARRRLLRLAEARRRLLLLRRASEPRHVTQLVTWLVTQLVIDYSASRRLVVYYFASASRPGALARRAARHAARRAARHRLLRLAQARRRLLRLCHASGCLGTSRGSSRGLLRGSSSNTLPPPRVWVPRHVPRLVTWFVAARRRLLRLRRASGCLGTSRGSSSTTLPTPRVRVPRHIAWLVAPLVVDYSASCRLVVDYFSYAARPSASARRAACHAARHAARHRLPYLAQARRRLLCLRRASGCLDTSRGSSRGSSRRSSSTTPPRAGSSSTTSPPPRIRVPRHVARLVTRIVVWLVVEYFSSTARLGASARPAALHVVRRRSSSTTPPRAGSSSTTSPPPRVWVPRHVVRLVVHYFAYTASPGASARRVARCTACRRPLRLRRASRCLGTSRGSSCGSLRHSSSTTSPTPRVRVPRHVARLVTRLIIDYSVRRDFVLRPGCLGTSRGSSHGSSSTTPCAATSSCGHAGSTSTTSCVVTTCLAATLALLRVRRVPPRRRPPVASHRPFISTSFPN